MLDTTMRKYESKIMDEQDALARNRKECEIYQKKYQKVQAEFENACK